MHFIKSVEQSFHQWLANPMSISGSEWQCHTNQHKCECGSMSLVAQISVQMFQSFSCCQRTMIADSKHECAQSTRVDNVNVVVKHLTMFVFNNELHRFTSCIDWCKQWSWNDHWQWAMNRTQSNMNNRALTDRSTTMRVLLLCSICVMWLFWWIWVCLWRKANWCGGIDWWRQKQNWHCCCSHHKSTSAVLIVEWSMNHCSQRCATVKKKGGWAHWMVNHNNAMKFVVIVVVMEWNVFKCLLMLVHDCVICVGFVTNLLTKVVVEQVDKFWMCWHVEHKWHNGHWTSAE